MKKHAKKIVTALLVIAMLVPTVAMIVSNAATTKTVELAFNNIFVLEKWASNALSPTVISDGVPNTGGTLATDIANGSITLTKTDMAAIEFYTAFSANATDAAGNEDYYMMDVEPNTDYIFSYHLSGTTKAFTPYVFMYTNEGLYAGEDTMVTYSMSEYNASNSFNFTTPSNVDKIQVRFTLGDNSTKSTGNSTASSVTATIKDIVIQEVIHPEETPNLFRFDDWAANKLSTAVLTGNGTLTTDTTANSFTITKTDSNLFYTGFSMDSASATNNVGYYTMDVYPGIDYSFTCNVSKTENDTTQLYPHIFYFNESNLCIGNEQGPQAITRYNWPLYRFDFTTPAGTSHIQIRFTLGGAATSGITIKDIILCKTTEFKSADIFDFDTWIAKEGSGGGISGYYTNATPTRDADSITLTTTNTSAGGAGLTNFALGAFDDTHYTIDTTPGKTYFLAYDLSVANGMQAPQLEALIPWYDSSKSWTSSYGEYASAATGENFFGFTVPANVEYFQIVFGIFNYTAGTSATISNIRLYEVDFTELLVESDPVEYYNTRKTYTYSGDGSTYGTLPEPTNVPDGMVFAGWYTGPDGTGDRITANTEISYESYSVFAKFEPAVNSLSVKTPPTKTTYTVGEKFNPAGLVLTYGINTQEDTNGDGTMETVTKTTDISTGYYCTPEYLNTVGTQAITVSYGGKTATFNVTVTDGDDKNIVVNGANHAVKVANNLYTLNYTGSAFNRYEITYFSDAYARGIITFDDDTTEEFFIEPSDNGHFASYVDNFLGRATHTGVKKISFTGLNKDFADIELLSLTTVNATVPTSSLQYYENEKYKVGIDLAFGGVISYIECLEGSTDGNDKVVAATYTDEKGRTYTKVDYKDKLPAGAIGTVESVNLINTWDRGRYLQQSYYGTDQLPFIMGDYNGLPWNYNPVQGGNLESTITHNGGEASKVIDYRITGSQIYVKTRPLDWGKNSIDYGQNKNDPAWNTPSYMEAWYTFTTDGKGLIQGSCRFIDYSGYPANTTTQEFPALYTVEPLNHFVYNNVTEDQAWDATREEFKNDSYLNTVADTKTLGTGAINIEEPDFWGVLPSYNEYNPEGPVDPDIVAHENWAAFTASEDKDSFGIGIYSPGVTDIHYGCFVAKYEENQYKTASEQDATVDGGYIVAKKAGTEASYTHVENYRHASTLDPAVEMNTSYIAPINTLTFESYKPISYTYYVSTGTADEIREDFRLAKETEENAQKEVTKIAVPETVYMTPVADGATHTTIGKNYVNNALSDLNAIYTIAEPADNMYFGMYALDAKEFTVKVTNATDPSNEIDFYNLSDSKSAEGEILTCTESRYRADDTYGLKFTGTGLKHGEKATAKWEITVTLNDNTTKTYTAYTVLYAPERTVGAVAEARRNSNAQNELSSWITGANGVDHSQRAPLGSFKGDYRNSGYFRVDPLANPDTLPTGGSAETAYDYIILSTGGTNNGSNGDYQDDCYVMQTATSGEDDSRSHSYLGLLKIDKSRYSNTDQIPNLKIGYDALRVGGYEKDSFATYNTYYTLGTETAFTSTDIAATPSGWTTHSSYSELYGANGGVIPYRETVVPSYTVSDDLNGKYIHAIAYGRAYNTLGNSYSTAGTSVLISITDKSELRDAVLDGYDVTDGTPLFNEKLQNAATVLGDPSATQEEIDNAKKELSDASKFALKYDNLFSALEFSQHSANMIVKGGGTASYENGTIIIKNDTITAGETYTEYSSANKYYNIGLKPNTEYVFEYDVTTTSESQAFLFFYDTNGNATNVTGRSLQTDNGAIVPNNEDVPHFGNYQHGAGTKHYAIRFTTGSDIGSVGFRFGNTTNNPCTSTFSKIKLIDSAHYYEGASYEKTEAAYAKDASYASLITPTRPGYTFVKWVDAEGNTVSASDVATNHLSVFSVWTANTYTITYNANGGSVSPTSKQYTPDETVTLPKPTNGGYVFQNWKVTTADGNWTSGTVYQANTNVTGMYGNVTLTAQWTVGNFKAYFDTILDFSEWKPSTATAINATISDVTSNGFTLTSNADAGEGYISSPYFTVEPGKSYKLDIDIVGDGWDVYLFFCDANGNWIDFDDGKSDRWSSNGSGADINNPVLTAPNDNSVVKGQIRLDANGASNTVKFSDIRVYEVDTRAPNVDVSYSSKDVTYNKAFETLPEATREGYTFQGWYDGDTQITADTIVTQTSDIYLKSKWVLNNESLEADNVVIDFSTPIAINPLANDAIFNAEPGTDKKIVGFSADGGETYTETLNGTYGAFSFNGTEVTYKPTKVLNDIEEVYYYASLKNTEGTTTTVKSKITVAPASNVLYEETFFGGNENLSSLSGKEWTTDGTALTASQTSSLIEDEVYGYDSNKEGYNKSANYSNGTAKTVTVDGTNNRISKNITFTFTGTGFDLNSACGANTGVMIVSVKNLDTNTIVKSYVVDTYYGDANYGIASNSNTLYQVPIISESELGYGNYTIQIVASWLPSMSGAISADKAKEAEEQQKLQQASVNGLDATVASGADNEALRNALAELGLDYIFDAEEVEVVWFDDNSVLNGGMGADTPVASDKLETASLDGLVNVIDSVRVYQPIENGNDYYIATEKNAVYHNVIDNLVKTEGGNVTIGEDGLFAYITGDLGVDEDGNAITLSVSNYESVGPKNELYLSESTSAVAFKVNNFAAINDANGKVMISLRAASGTPKLKIGGTDFPVSSNTEMYYDITKYIAADGTVTLQNTKDLDTDKSLLAIGSLKITCPVSMQAASISSDVDLETVRMMMMAPSVTVEPNTTPTPEEPEVPENPEDPNEPEIPEEPEEPAEENWLIRIFKWIINTVIKIFNTLKGFLAI